MQRLLADNNALDVALLAANEEEYDKQAQLLVARLQKTSRQDLAADLSLEYAVASRQTIVYLYFLRARFSVATSTGKNVSRQLPQSLLPSGLLWPYITKILLEFDPIQVRYASDQFLRVISVLGQGAEETSTYIPAITLLHHVILRLDPSSSTYTSVHHTFIRLCLLARAYAEAISLLDLPIYHIPAENDRNNLQRTNRYVCSPQEPSARFVTEPITTRKYLEYNLMAGLCYLAMRQYSKARFFLEIVLTAPTSQNVASLIMVDAYKKWVLVNLLMDGESREPPKSATQSAMKLVRTVAKPYDCLADAFKSPSLDRLRAEIEEASEIWQQDGNYGLVLDVYEAHRNFAISRLGNTFAAVSVAEIRRRIAPEQSVTEILQYIQGLIANGTLNATLTKSATDGSDMLRFMPSVSNTKTEGQVEQELALQTRELKGLLQHISDIDHRLESSGEYIEYLKKLKKVKDEFQKTGGKSGLTVEEVDEDMMEEF